MPIHSPLTRRSFALALAAALVAPASAGPKDKLAGKSPLAKFLDSLWPDAEKAGVTRATFDAAFQGVAYDPKIVAHTAGQAEFVLPIWSYLAGAVSRPRIEAGQAKYAQWKTWLDKAQGDYGVDAGVVMAIWGIETGYGAFQGGDYVVKALASLALSKYQPDYFRDELIAALTILQNGDIDPRHMLGSWAGAMGQTQFMPSSYLQYAVDFDGDGKRDIWGSAADAIGSTAHYLAGHGWKRDAPWGFEVLLPEGFPLADADSSTLSSFFSFASRGVKRADGQAMPWSGEGRLMILAGLSGPIFLVTDNFKVIKSYNNSTSYALAVALLGDRILGGGELVGQWPAKDRQLTGAEIKDLQTRLAKMGYDVGEIDGKAGDSLRAAVRRYQGAIGQPPDGYPTPALLKRIAQEP